MNQLHRRNKRRRIFWTIITVGAIVFFLYQLLMAPFRLEDLRENKIITVGKITGTFNNQRNTGSGLYYTFNISNKLYKGSTAYSNLPTSFCKSLMGRSFPVIYSPTSINNNDMLLTYEFFKIYDMQQPDSLKWIEEYVRKW